MNSLEKIKVLLVDDHQLIRDGVQSMLGNTADLEVIGSVSSGEDAINSVRENRPDLILMDIMMGGMTDIETTRWDEEFMPNIKLILLNKKIRNFDDTAGIKSGWEGYL